MKKQIYTFVGLIVAAIVLTVTAILPAVQAQRGLPTENQLSDSRCTFNNLRGAYGYNSSGFIVPPGSSAPLPYASAGRFVLGADGSVTAAETISVNGSITQQNVTGVYTVDAETCTGTAVTSAGTFNFSVVDNRKEFRLVGATPTTVIAATAKRQ
jgi:hypothetical protein